MIAQSKLVEGEDVSFRHDYQTKPSETIQIHTGSVKEKSPPQIFKRSTCKIEKSFVQHPPFPLKPPSGAKFGDLVGLLSSCFIK